MTNDITSPFGTYALSPKREAMRQSVSHLKTSRLNRAFISRARKKAIAGLNGPFDVSIEDGIKARLYPANNRCEKRALCGVQTWDAPERQALNKAISSATDNFVFLDVGANVGLYGLFAHHYAQKANQKIRVIAIEPASEIADRLAFNFKASDLAVDLIRSAVSDVAGTGSIEGGETNKGEAHLSLDGHDVDITTLPMICDVLAFSHINAMKLDIEGHDLRVLKHFFETAPQSLYPDMLILETEPDGQALLELAQSHAYVIHTQTKMNTVLEKNSNV